MIIIKWVMVLTLYNPAADRVGQYKVYPFDTEAACQAKVEAHMATHQNNEIPNRYVIGACYPYQVNWSWF